MFGRPANSGCVRSMPVSSTVIGLPGPGGTAESAPTSGHQYSVDWSGSTSRRTGRSRSTTATPPRATSAGSRRPGTRQMRSRRDRSDPPAGRAAPRSSWTIAVSRPRSREQARRRGRQRGGARGERARGRDERDQAEEADRSGQATHATAAALSSRAMQLAYIGLGANLGDREATMRARARGTRRRVRCRASSQSRRSARPTRSATSTSRASSTAPLRSRPTSSPRGCPRRAARGRAGARPHRGRGRGYGPRTIDLDLLLYGDAALDEPGPDRPASAAPRAARSCSSRSRSSTPASSSPAVARWRACAEI